MRLRARGGRDVCENYSSVMIERSNVCGALGPGVVENEVALRAAARAAERRRREGRRLLAPAAADGGAAHTRRPSAQRSGPRWARGPANCSEAQCCRQCSGGKGAAVPPRPIARGLAGGRLLLVACRKIKQRAAMILSVGAAPRWWCNPCPMDSTRRNGPNCMYRPPSYYSSHTTL